MIYILGWIIDAFIVRKIRDGEKLWTSKTHRSFSLIKTTGRNKIAIRLCRDRDQDIAMLEINENSFHSPRKTRIFIEILCLVSRILMCRIYTRQIL